MRYMCQYHFTHIVTLLNVSALKGSSSGSADTLRQQDQQNACQDLNIRLYRNLLYFTWQFSNLSPVITWNTYTNQKVKHNSGTMYLKAIWWDTNQMYWINFDQFFLVSLISTIMLEYKFFPPWRNSTGQGFLIIEVSRSHSDTPHWVGLLWTIDQSDEQTSTGQYSTFTTVIHARCGIRIRNPSRRSAADEGLWPRGHWDRLLKCIAFLMQCKWWRAPVKAKFYVVSFYNFKT